ncbi:MAG: serine/threonine protein kinase [Oscillatoriaceae bacterium SKW80]|nr:serine/threonine protein kinase [Oscillatoriaceae bacterium SKYG93]MCX8120322.1 serine/threonine protein kinase [Oscillatoriaceae bacterium SKW80]MDW8453248.1 serine/threonine-protein kinase [Oscillatoriaceae cyanobacterium SKYGB_i_bin93]HIK27309.1 serine/threonine protein kinase [Oscillatoriaceae cyanobacterium M7585_C2015_266]
MTFCLNPDCQNPQNPDDVNRCRSCGAKLLLLARYRVLKPLGKPGGSTFLAVDERKRSKPKCVVKQFFPSQGESPSEVFAQTAKHLAELGKHNHFPQLLTTCERDGRYYLISEFIEGPNLAQKLFQEGSFTETEILQLLDEMLSALQLLQEKQLIHGDIKPENIIYTTDNRYVLVGFGGASNIRATAYTAPEQAKGKTNYTSDLYSLGVICMHLLTQIHPLELLDSKKDTWVWQDYTRHDISEGLRQVIERMLHRFSLRRFQSAAEVIWELHPELKPTVSPPPSIPIVPLEPQNWECVRILRGHEQIVRCLALSPDETVIASGSQDGKIKLWDFKTGQLLHTLEADQFDVRVLIFTPDGQTLISGSNNKTVKLWNPHTGELQRTLVTLRTSIYSMALSPDGQIIATGESDGSIRLWEFQTGALLETLREAEGKRFWRTVDALEFSPDGQYLITSSEVWDVIKGKKLYSYMPQAVWGHSVAVSPDGETFAVTGDTNRTGKLIHLRSGEVIYTFKGHLKALRAVAFRPDGRVLATASKDGRVKLWNLQNGRLIQTIPGHSRVVFDMVFSRDGQTLITCAEDKKVKIWQCS